MIDAMNIGCGLLFIAMLGIVLLTDMHGHANEKKEEEKDVRKKG